MSIRVKFLVALLVALLLPTVFAAVLGYRSSVTMSRVVAADQRQTLLAEAEGVLLAVLRKNVEIFERQMSTYFAATQVQWTETLRCLESDEPPTSPRLPIAAFRAGGDAPGLAPAEDHVIVHGDGTRSPALISRDAPAIYVAPEGSAADADRLADLGPLFRAFSPATIGTAYWQFVTLDSGVHVVYPGHGLLPDDYDAREDAVYQRARENIGRGYGSPPSVDPATGQTLVGMVGPVRDAAGDVIGVTGVLSRMDAILDGLRFGAEWGDDADNFLATLAPAEDGRLQVSIIARRSYAQAEQGQSGFIGLQTFEADDPEDTAELAEAFSTGRTGSLILSVDGRELLCTYSGFRQDRLGLASLVPVTSIAVIADRTAERIRSRARTQLVGVLIGLTAFALGMSLAAFLGARVITQPIATLATAIRRLAAGDLEVRAEVESRDEVGELAEAFNKMVPQLRDHMRIRHSLDLAQEVQRGLLPEAPPAVPGFDIAARSIYCDETGGDYFDFIDFDQPAAGSLAIAVGDVTGHGVAAALLMATARALLRMRATLPGQLADHIADINRHLAADADSGRFMTLFLLILDADHRHARWVGAGHDPVMVYDPGSGAFSELAGVDIPLGVEAGWAFSERSTDGLRPGQIMILGTDGIWEAHNGKRQMFGKERLRECVRRHADAPADRIAEAVVEEVRAFRGDLPQEDDVTLVVIRLTPEG